MGSDMGCGEEFDELFEGLVFTAPKKFTPFLR
jgi:hypothetical protein